MLRVGVIGGGQLARMMTPAAINLGIELRVLAEGENSSANLAASMIGDYTDLATVKEFAKEVDVITFDHEHVPLEILRSLETAGVSVQPPSKALAHAQNKLLMRQALAEIGAPNPNWRAISSAVQLQEFIDEFGPEIIVKTPIGGYDGKGVRVVSNPSDVSDWLEETSLQSLGGALLAEEKVSFKRELAQLGARSPSGDFASWPVVETRQLNGVCSEVIAPAQNLSQDQISRAREIYELISEKLGVTGNLAVEMFETQDGQLLVNELAMRPHNSGHFSIEGSLTSQFEQHLRAVLDLPLGSTELTAKVCVMANLLGASNERDFRENYPKALAKFPEVKVHSYDKSPRIGRKLGHLTILGDDADLTLSRAIAARDLLLDVSSQHSR
jgi:5-(carboxyamino)imidazole ribonucleotide synthase